MAAISAPQVRPATPADWPAVWAALRPVFRAGESFPVLPNIGEAAARAYWTTPPKQTFVAATAAGGVAGCYYIAPNQPGLGAHVCNCGYAVAPNMRGRGVASLMCEDSQRRARAMGYRAMQFNLVVSTNTAAVRLWQKHNFSVVGVLPGAFCHPRLGDVDAYIMRKSLTAAGAN